MASWDAVSAAGQCLLIEDVGGSENAGNYGGQN